MASSGEGEKPGLSAARSAGPVSTKTCLAAGAQTRNAAPPCTRVAPKGVSRVIPVMLAGIAPPQS